MTQAKDITCHVIGNTSIPYVSYTDITSEKPVFVGGQNVLTTSRQLMYRRPGFADAIESSITTFTGVQKQFAWSKWGGTRFIWLVNDVSGSQSKVYKKEIGVDPSYQLLYTSSSTNQFWFVVSNNTLFFGNGVDMRAYDATNTWGGAQTRNWGITRPSAVAAVGTTGTGISSYAGGWYYRYTFCNSLTGHESSASELSACTGIVANKTITLGLTASTDAQVDQIRVYRTTDGGSTNATQMREITGSPFANATATVNDTTSDTVFGTRLCPGTTSNDPPPALKNFSWYGGRIFGSINNQTWFSGFEELPANGVPEECFPSGLSGNYYNWDTEVTGQASLPDGVAVFTRGRIWKIEGNLRANFQRYKLVEKRGATNQNCIFSLGNSVAWLDTANQVWSSDLGEIGNDIRTDIEEIDQSKASMCVHVSGSQHWICLLDGGQGKLYVYDLDTRQWMPPWILPSGSTAIISEEYSAGVPKLGVAVHGTKIYLNNADKYNDAGTTYSASAVLNLLPTHAAKNPDHCGLVDYVNVETDGNTNSYVGIMIDDNPQLSSFQDITANAQDPPLRKQGTNLVKKQYGASQDAANSTVPTGQRVSVSLQWAAAENNFTLYTIEVGWHLWRQ